MDVDTVLSEGAARQAPLLRDAIVGFAVYVVLGYGLSWVVLHFFTPLWWIAAAGVVWIAIFGWSISYPLWIARRRGISSPIRRLPLPRLGIEFLIAAGAAFAIYIVEVMLAASFAEELAAVPAWQERYIEAGRITPYLLLMAALAVSLGPIAEELMFRWLIYRALRARTALWAAVVGQALLFASIHDYPVIVLPVIFTSGCIYALVYEWRKTLLTPILAHSMSNIAAVTLLFISISLAAATPMLGVGTEHIRGGAQVTYIFPGSGADQAGLIEGDVITGIDDERIITPEDLAQTVQSYEVGDIVEVRFRRAGYSMTAKARIGQRNP